MSDYQLFPDMGTAEYEEMKADIQSRGVMIPVEYDEAGNILDGHHRVKACQELGIKEWPSVVRLGMSEKDKRNHIRKLNLARRHLTGEQRDKVLLDMRADGMSVRQIADETKIPKSTVARIISTVPLGTVELPTVITGKDGKQRQSTQPERKAPEPELPIAVESNQAHESNPPTYDGSAAYCKYCYTTHSEWEYTADICCDRGHGWICKKCDHCTADEVMAVAPAPRMISIQVAAPSQVSRVAEKASAVLEAAQENPALSRLVDQMERSGKVNAALRQVNKLQAADAINAEPIPMPTGPFRVIVADPPWHYESRVGDFTHRSDLPYPSMQIDEICALPVEALAHDDCILWLWTTNAHMRESYAVLDAWGFQSKTILTWAKDRIGTGDWLRGQTEHCHLAIRGKPTILTTGQGTIIHGPLQAHSQKPDSFYALVDAICPGSKLEMFCRSPREGWAAWGNES